MGKRRVPLRRICGIRALVPALAGAFAAILLVLASPPADAEAVRAGYKAASEPTGHTCTMADEKMLGGSRSEASSSVEGAVSSLVRQAEEIEAELAQAPGDEGLLANLTRTRINAANAMIANGAGESKGGVEEMKQQLALADVAWSEYLKATKKPSLGLATLVAPALFRLAELSSAGQEALKNVKVAAAAQKIVVESRPGKNSWSTLAFYDLFAQNYKAADKAIEKATSYADTKLERKSIKKRFEAVEKDAKQFAKRLKSR